MKILKYFVILFMGVAILSSCEKLNEPKLITDSQVGFEFSSTTVIIDYLATNDVTTTVKVMLIGAQQSTPITMDIAVDDTSDAIEGTHFDLGSTTVTIPANSSFGEFTIIGHPSGFTGGGQYKDIVLTVTAATGGAVIAPNFATFTAEMQSICSFDLNNFVGTWTGTDSWGYDTEVVTTLVGGELYITGIGYGWFQDWWGEVIITSTPLLMTFDAPTATFTIAEQPYLTSTWNGAAQPPYSLSASGTFDACSTSLTFNYAFNQAGWVFTGTDWGPAFKETITKL